jgi:phytoene synthase
MDALYAFTRHTDDLADNAEPIPKRREALAQWRASLEAALAERPRPAQRASRRDVGTGQDRRAGQDGEPDALGGAAGHALLPAVVETVRQFNVPPEHLFAVVDGVAMDLDHRRYETFDQLAAYCEKVASSVGFACAHIWGFFGSGAFEPARKCGLAFQVTNILRDLREDAEQGRVDLPQDDLRASGYTEADLMAGVVDARFERLMALEIDRARRFYHEGAELFPCLEPDGRRVFGMMTTVYHGLLERIARRPGDVFRRRVSLPRWQKLAIAARWALLPARRSGLP